MVKSFRFEIKENIRFSDGSIVDFFPNGSRKLTTIPMMGMGRGGQISAVIRKSSMNAETPKISPYGLGGIGNFYLLFSLILMVVLELDIRSWRDHNRISMR